ncbi:PD40 domain-containing protein [Kordia sp. YSTF-M3]|uniref:PD40 domain-containing protein n=1 Tax=Kordia aestuariivivens TaxID=2759037 RepID=A0ABR7Q733_9FLAO|nr:PD40 domain-containing protein [Kordia aestuariivivens]MBC8754353.1 PD40 domain-containing protein [Kordia aestuariivivens]
MKVIDIHPITQTGTNSKEHFVDGRPCFSPDGNTVLFERTGKGIPRAQFWTVDIQTNSENPYYKSDTYGCLRASWTWNPTTGLPQIAFTGIYPEGDNPTSRVMLLDENGADNSATHLTVPGYQDAQLSYPAWYPNEPALLMTNYSQLELLKVNIISLKSSVLTPNNYWSGMGTLNRANPKIIAYAGQTKGSGAYHQKINKVLLQVGQNNPVVFSDPAKGTIGRTPWFSPDGNIMAFEAYSTQPKLQIFLKKVDLANPNTPIIHVKGPSSPAQHPKFSPDGSRLVWAQNDGQGKTQIYMGTVSMDD